MSTPMDPRQTSAGSDQTDQNADGQVQRASTSPRWADADVAESSTASGVGHLPPVHVTGRREPDVQIRDTAETREPLQQEPVRHDTVHMEPVRQEGPTLSDRSTSGEPLRAQPMVVGATPDRQTVVAREHERFGGMKFGSAFFGWLTATGLAVLLLAILAAAGVAFGVATSNKVDQAVSASQNATGTAKTVGLVGAIVLLVILFVAYYCGGYVAGRMARFDGVKQGLGVWIWALITSAVIAGVAAIAGAKYNVLAQLNLPRIPVDEGSVTTVGIIAIVAAILVALLGALLGGAVGTRYHRKVDAVGFEVDESVR
jgi:hypothetical protein